MTTEIIYKTFLQITSLFYPSRTTGNLLVSSLCPNSWPVLTIELGDFNQGVSNQDSVIIRATHCGFFPHRLQSLWVPRRATIKRMNKRARVLLSSLLLHVSSGASDESLQGSSRREDGPATAARIRAVTQMSYSHHTETQAPIQYS